MGAVKIEIPKTVKSLVKGIIEGNIEVQTMENGEDLEEPKARLCNFESYIWPSIEKVINDVASDAVTRLEDKIKKEMGCGDNNKV